MRYLDEFSSLHFIDVIKSLTDKYFTITNRESLALELHRNLFVNSAHVLLEKYVVDKQLQEMVIHMDQQRKLGHENQILKLPDSNSKFFLL